MFLLNSDLVSIINCKLTKYNVDLIRIIHSISSTNHTLDNLLHAIKQYQTVYYYDTAYNSHYHSFRLQQYILIIPFFRNEDNKKLLDYSNAWLSVFIGNSQATNSLQLEKMYYTYLLLKLTNEFEKNKLDHEDISKLYNEKIIFNDDAIYILLDHGNLRSL